MSVILTVIDFILHFDHYLGPVIADYGLLAYILLFIVVFCETGLVVTPFLPGDSLLFISGAFAASGSLNLVVLVLLFASAAILGDAANYHIGKRCGDALRARRKIRFIKMEHIERTSAFFERHGGKTIMLARFMPIIRTFAPFVAGAGAMGYKRFLYFNALGGLLWVSLFTFGGYFFGNLQFVKDNFSLVVIAIIFISLLPPVVIKLRDELGKRKNGR